MYKVVVACAFVAFIGLVSGEKCEFKDKMCSLPYTKTMQKEILKYHNDVRSKANPTASNMEKMYWDETMAKMAQAHTDKCIMEHDSGSDRDFNGYINVGQNIFGSTFKPAAYLPAKGWHDEIKWFTYGQRSSHTVGHYTQVMRGPAARIGCGFAYCPNLPYKYFVTCNYLTGNSVIRPYKLGKPCAECPNSCKNNLCDCGGKVCKRGSKLDLNTCKCQCPENLEGELCEKVKCGGKVCQRDSKLNLKTCKCKCPENTYGEFCEKVRCDIKEKWQCSHYKRAGYCDLKYGYVCRNECPISCNQC